MTPPYCWDHIDLPVSDGPLLKVCVACYFRSNSDRAIKLNNKILVSMGTCTPGYFDKIQGQCHSVVFKAFTLLLFTSVTTLIMMPDNLCLNIHSLSTRKGSLCIMSILKEV